MRSEPKGSLEVFYAYAHEDERFRKKLEKHLSIMKNQGLIKDWHDHKIIAGQVWSAQVYHHLYKAHIILLLISDDFLASEHTWRFEVNVAMERYRAQEAVVIPIILRPVDWAKTVLGTLKALPTDGKPITNWRRLDDAFLNIAEGIRDTVDNLLHRQEAIQEFKQQYDELITQRNARILVVEDSTAVWNSINRALEKFAPNYNATFVSGGIEALKLIQEHSFDLIILDLGLPDIGGFEVIKQLRETDHNFPILMHSVTSYGNIQKGFLLGANDYLGKPLSGIGKQAEFILRIEALLARENLS